MPYETKKQQRDRLLTEFLWRIADAPAGTRVYMPTHDVVQGCRCYPPSRMAGQSQSRGNSAATTMRERGWKSVVWPILSAVI
jgi:hypothetical protein